MKETQLAVCPLNGDRLVLEERPHETYLVAHSRETGAEIAIKVDAADLQRIAAALSTRGRS